MGQTNLLSQKLRKIKYKTTLKLIEKREIKAVGESSNFVVVYFFLICVQRIDCKVWVNRMWICGRNGNIALFSSPFAWMDKFILARMPHFSLSLFLSLSSFLCVCLFRLGCLHQMAVVVSIVLLLSVF